MGRNALDLPVAALAGLAVAFVAYAVPGDLLAELVTMSGLPSILPAAQPPLGGTARAGFGLGAALAAFGLVFALLRLLDRTAEAEADEAPAAPRVRRRDFHPDAPAPRPFALRDLGEPEADEAVPLWLAPADAVGANPADADGAGGGEVPEVHGRERFADEEKADEVPEVPNVPNVHDGHDAEIHADAGESAEPLLLTDPEPPVRSAPVPQPEREPQAAGSISELMARLERGLAARRSGAGAALFEAAGQPRPAEAFADAPAQATAPADDRLQSAIASLQRLAAHRH